MTFFKELALVFIQYENINLYVYEVETKYMFFVGEELIDIYERGQHFSDFVEKLKINMFINQQFVKDLLLYKLSNPYDSIYNKGNNVLNFLYGQNVAGKIKEIVLKLDDEEDCCDNFRIADVNSMSEMRLYDLAAENGCCGSSDEIYEIEGKHIKIGCNYGH